MTRVVVKVGGSLLEWPELPFRLAKDLVRRDRPLLIMGGGRLVDLVRDLDRLHTLGDERSHQLALRVLDVTAHALAALMPDVVVITSPDQAEAVRASGRWPVLAPRCWLDSCEQDTSHLACLPHSWEVTSDSIAAYLTDRVEAVELVLLKSAPLPPQVDRVEAARLGLVDPRFSDAARRLTRVTYRNLRDPDATDMTLV